MVHVPYLVVDWFYVQFQDCFLRIRRLSIYPHRILYILVLTRSRYFLEPLVTPPLSAARIISLCIMHPKPTVVHSGSVHRMSTPSFGVVFAIALRAHVRWWSYDSYVPYQPFRLTHRCRFANSLPILSPRGSLFWRHLSRHGIFQLNKRIWMFLSSKIMF